MSDQSPQPDDAQPPTGKQPPESTGAEPGDATQAMPPVEPGEPTEPSDATQAMPPVGPGEPVGPGDLGAADDATTVLPGGPGEPTTVLPGGPGEPTTVLPGAAGWNDDATRVSLPEDAWTGRAEVRPAGPGEVPPEEWVDDEPGRRWWLPLVIGIIGVLIVIAIVLAIVLARRNDDNTPSPVVSTPAPSSAPASPSPQPSPSPSPLPSSAGPTSVTVVVPKLAGHSLADATSQLSTLGLTWTVTYQDSTEQPDGYVIATSPTADTVLSPGQQVTLIVARNPQPSSEAPSPEPSSAAPSVAAS